MLIRLQNNTPSVYTKQSRDFQLFCRLYDCVINAVKYDIDTIVNINNVLKVNDRLLELYCTKVGFFTNKHFNSKILRAIISAFPYVIKNKGSKKGIEEAVTTILKVENKSETPEIVINNTTHTIVIYTFVKVFNKDAMLELLSYIIPIGYTYEIQESTPIQVQSQISTINNLVSIKNPIISTSQVRGTDRIKQTGNAYNFTTDIENNFVGSFIGTQVIGASTENNLEGGYLTTKEYSKDRNNTNRDTIDSHTTSESFDINQNKVNDSQDLVEKVIDTTNK